MSGAEVALAAVFVGASIGQIALSRSAAKTERFGIDLNTEASLLQGQEMVLARASAFTDSIAVAAAEAARGVGAATGFTQVAFKGLGNLQSDMNALSNKARFDSLSGASLRKMSLQKQKADMLAGIASMATAGMASGMFSAPATTPTAPAPTAPSGRPTMARGGITV